MRNPKVCQSQDYSLNNLLDRHTPAERLQHFYRHFAAREVLLLLRYCRELFENGGSSIRILSVGCGPDASRGLPPGKYYLVGVDSDSTMVARARECGTANQVKLAPCNALPFDDEDFDLLIFRGVLHHVVYQGSLFPAIREAHRVLKSGGVIVVVEPNLFHPVGTLLALSNLFGLSKRIHGTVDDCPLSPFQLMRIMASVGFSSRVSGLTYSWRRLPIRIQKLVEGVSSVGVLPVLKYVAHSFMIIGRKRMAVDEAPLPTVSSC